MLNIHQVLNSSVKNAVQVEEAQKFMSFFGHSIDVNDERVLERAKEQRNTGEKQDVYPETLKLLDEFYKPYNERLAVLLGDNKWLYINRE